MARLIVYAIFTCSIVHSFVTSDANFRTDAALRAASQHNNAYPPVSQSEPQCAVFVLSPMRVLLFTSQHSLPPLPFCFPCFAFGFCRKSCRSRSPFLLSPPSSSSRACSASAWPAINSLTDTEREREAERVSMTGRTRTTAAAAASIASASLLVIIPLPPFPSPLHSRPPALVPSSSILVSNGLSSSASPSDAEQRIAGVGWDGKVRPQQRRRRRRRRCLSLSNVWGWAASRRRRRSSQLLPRNFQLTQPQWSEPPAGPSAEVRRDVRQRGVRACAEGAGGAPAPDCGPARGRSWTAVGRTRQERGEGAHAHGDRNFTLSSSPDNSQGRAIVGGELPPSVPRP